MSPQNRITPLLFSLQFLALIVCSSASEWSSLRVTWSANLFSSWAFDKLPRDSSADLDGFVPVEDYCALGEGPFLGARYRKDSDRALALLFDKNGFIAGIQTSVPKSKLTPSNRNRNHPAISDGDYWTFTAYFVRPATICTSGRSRHQFEAEGTGYGLWIQNGTDAVRDSIEIPLTESGVQQTLWTFGHCFYSMGNHYWYNVSTNMSCDDFFPFFLMYNGGKLNSFGFALNAQLTSRRYEHPTASSAAWFINPVPTCFHSDPGYNELSTIHVYMTNYPYLFNRC